MSDLWLTDGWPTPEAWQAVGAVATTIVAAGAAWIALRQLSSHHKAQLDQSRPYVIVDFAFRSHLLMIEIRNIGHSPAEDIKLNWSPAPQTTEARRTEVLKRNLVEGTIPFLAPGRSLKYAVDTVPRILDAADLPKRFEVTASYRDTHGNNFPDERSILDLSQWANALVESDYDNKNSEELKRQTAAQQKMAAELKALEQHGRGLLQSFAHTAILLISASSRGEPSGARWAVIPNSADGRLVANVGTATAQNVEITEVGFAEDLGILRIDDRLPRDVEPADSVAVELFVSMGSPSTSHVRVTWTEGGSQQREATLRIN